MMRLCAVRSVTREWGGRLLMCQIPPRPSLEESCRHHCPFTRQSYDFVKFEFLRQAFYLFYCFEGEREKKRITQQEKRKGNPSSWIFFPFKKVRVVSVPTAIGSSLSHYGHVSDSLWGAT